MTWRLFFNWTPIFEWCMARLVTVLSWVDTKKPSVTMRLEYMFKMQTSSLFVELNIWFNVADTIYHRPTLILLQSHGDNKERVSRDTCCYITSREDHFNFHATLNETFSAVKTTGWQRERVSYDTFFSWDKSWKLPRLPCHTTKKHLVCSEHNWVATREGVLRHFFLTQQDMETTSINMPYHIKHLVCSQHKWVAMKEGYYDTFPHTTNQEDHSI